MVGIPNVTLGPKPATFSGPPEVNPYLVLPPNLFNLRIKTGIEEFFQEYGLFLKKLGIKHNFTLELPGEQVNNLFMWKYGNIIIVGRQDENDGNVLTYFRVIINNFPLLVSIDPREEYFSITSFRIILQRIYPIRLDLTQVIFDNIPFHPNINPNDGRFGNHLFAGEIGSVLWDVIQLLLFEPARIIQTSDQSDSIDFALNKEAMEWYQTINQSTFYQDNINRFKKLIKNNLMRRKFFIF